MKSSLTKPRPNKRPIRVWLAWFGDEFIGDGENLLQNHKEGKKVIKEKSKNHPTK